MPARSCFLLPPVCAARRRDCRSPALTPLCLFSSFTIPQSPSATAPFTQGSLFLMLCCLSTRQQSSKRSRVCGRPMVAPTGFAKVGTHGRLLSHRGLGCLCGHAFSRSFLIPGTGLSGWRNPSLPCVRRAAEILSVNGFQRATSRKTLSSGRQYNAK